MLIPIFHGLVNGSDTRYVLPLFPIFSIISVYLIKRIFHEKSYREKILVILIFSIVLSSSVFLILKNVDLVHEKEAYEIAKHLITVNGINDYGKEIGYVRAAAIADLNPTLSTNIWKGPNTFDEQGFATLTEFINKNRHHGLDHIVVDYTSKSVFIEDFIESPTRYEFLEKIYDSSDDGYRYNLTIYKINYQKFDELYLNKILD